MANTSTHLTLPAELIKSIFSTVKGHSSVAALCGAEPIPFNGIDVMTFSMDGEAEVVGEGDSKSPGDASLTPVSIKPFKVVYQHRVTDEFVKMNEEKRLPYLQAFGDGFTKKIARAVDITSFHGLNPRTGGTVAGIAAGCFDTLVTNTINYAEAYADDNIDAAVQKIVDADREVTGIAMAPSFGSAMAKVKVNGVVQYPEFRFGGRPKSFAGYGCDINSTVKFGTNTLDKAIIGDFQNAFKWGYSENIPMEIIEYGDPDGQGDLKRKNQVVLRAEAYIGFGILDAASFSRIIGSAPEGATGATGATGA